jgi:predicted RNase H-like nuclease
VTVPDLRTDIAIGVDGCPGGWVAAIFTSNEDTLEFRVVGQLVELVNAYPGVVIAVDIPIGLETGVSRDVDAIARTHLGYPRAFSVFASPDRRLLGSRPWEEANALSREFIGKGLSRQSYGIMPKIEEVDAMLALDSSLQLRVVEVHPEMCFWKLNGKRPMALPKKRLDGFTARRDLLRTAFSLGAIPESPFEARRLVDGSRAIGRGASADDVLDAIVAAWTAMRFANGKAEVIPADPQRDECGLLMRMVF